MARWQLEESVAECLVVLAPGAEEIETLAVADVLVRAGQQVSVASLTGELVVPGSRGLPLAAHGTFDAIKDRDFALVYLPGGMRSAQACREDPRVQDLIARQLEAGRLLAIICASVTALVPRRLAARLLVTSYPGVRAEVEPHVRAWRDQAVVEDGNLITSQGPGTAIALGLALARRLAGETTAAQVAARHAGARGMKSGSCPRLPGKLPRKAPLMRLRPCLPRCTSLLLTVLLAPVLHLTGAESASPPPPPPPPPVQQLIDLQQALAGDDADAKRQALRALADKSVGNDDQVLPVLVQAVGDRQASDTAIQTLRSRTGLQPSAYVGQSHYPSYPSGDKASDWAQWLSERTKEVEEKAKLKEALKTAQDAKATARGCQDRRQRRQPAAPLAPTPGAVQPPAMAPRPPSPRPSRATRPRISASSAAWCSRMAAT